MSNGTPTLQLLLAPGTPENAETSLARPVDSAQLIAKLSDPSRKRWLQALGARNAFHAWALSEAMRRQFERLSLGDLVLISLRGTGTFGYVGIVSGKIECDEAGTHIWPLTHNQPWRLIYLLSRVRVVQLEKRATLNGLGFSPTYGLAGANLINAERFDECIKTDNRWALLLDDLIPREEADERTEILEDSTHTTFTEGGVILRLTNNYERNRTARALCIEYYGAVCCICGFNFGQKYGTEYNGIIHVHHIVPISTRSEAHQVNPITDLRPVCANCHVVIHSKKEPLEVDHVRHLIATTSNLSKRPE